MILATKTLEAINAALEKDQGARYRALLKEAMFAAKEPFEGGSKARKHLGASLIGRDCSRELWYTFRWATIIKHSGRLLRLFNRGHLEEPRLIALLRLIGCEVWVQDSAGQQFRFKDFGGHYAGSTDGVVRGIPDAPGVALLVEFKTHAHKSFEKLVAEGVALAKPEHYAQMQTYMKKLSLPGALYLGVNKNDDDIHAELVAFDGNSADRSTGRAELVIFNQLPPPKISQSSGWWQCKFCDHHGVCHMGVEIARSCRTCVSAKPQQNGSWLCERFGRSLSVEEQIKGCDEYIQLMHAAPKKEDAK